MTMDIIVDNESARFDTDENAETVLETIAQVSEALRANNRAIMAVAVDGKDIPYNELSVELEGKSPSDVNTIALTTQDLNALIDEAITELETNIPELAKVCHELAAVFQGEDALAGFGPFQEVATIWQHVKTREVQIASALDVKLSDQELQGKTLDDHHDELNGFLQEALQAMEARDTVLLGDLLEYELAPRAELETEVVALLKQIAGERRSGA